MPYQYVAYTRQGEKVKGRIEAPTESAAEESLWRLNYTVVSLKEVSGQASAFSALSRVSARELVVFSRQLATLIESGIPIMRSLGLLQEQVSSKLLRSVLAEMISDIRQGRYLSEAVGKHRNVFPSLYARLVEVGERTGNLESVLRQLALYIEKEDELVRKVRGAMAYPGFVLVLAFGVIFLMLTMALPPMMGLFESFGAELPLPTRILMALTAFSNAYKWYILGGVVCLVGGVVLFARTERGHWVVDRLMLKIPLIRTVVIEGAVARMCRSMSSLLQAGIPVPEILDMVIRTQSNRVIRAALERVHSQLLQGHGFADPLSQEKLFPRMLVQMVRVGEETGSLDSNMETLAGFYEQEVDRAVETLSGALQPALTLFIGGIVGFVAVSVIMPMYSLMGAIQ